MYKIINAFPKVACGSCGLKNL